MNALVDMALMVILIPRILHLKMHNRQKCILLAIVALGFIAVVAAVIRMVRVGTTLSKYSSGGFDPPWDTYDVTIWTSAEIYTSLICAAAPGVKPLVSMLLPHLLGTTLRSRTRNTGGQGYGTGAIEMSGKTKRTRPGTSGTILKSGSATALTAGSGQWIEVGRGADEESLGKTSDEESYHERLRVDGGIVKTSEVMVHTSEAVGIPVPSYPLNMSPGI